MRGDSPSLKGYLKSCKSLISSTQRSEERVLFDFVFGLFFSTKVMKRMDSSESLGGMVSVPKSADEKPSLCNNINDVYKRGFQSFLEGMEEEDSIEESGQICEKKRRLGAEQVKALEKNFEVENKLEPERKIKLAQELGLQPRQVAVWFQNRRARWKTKQLEKDYGLLKANYESLKLNYSALKHDKEALLAELEDMKSKREEKTIEATASIKEEVTQENQEAENKASYITKSNEESDSSAILDNSSPQHAISPNGSLPKQPMMISPIISSSLSFGCGSSSSTSSANCLEFSEMRAFGVNAHKGYHQFLKMGEHNFLSLAEDDCSFFSEEQAPGFPWYCPEPWN